MFVIVSPRLTAGDPGDVVTREDLAGLNVDAMLAAGQIEPVDETPTHTRGADPGGTETERAD